jgi:hypothetical protein
MSTVSENAERSYSVSRIFYCDMASISISLEVNDTNRYYDLDIDALQRELAMLLSPPINKQLTGAIRHRFPSSSYFPDEWRTLLTDCSKEASQIDCMGLSSDGIVELSIVIGSQLSVDIHESVYDIDVNQFVTSMNSAIADLIMDYQAQLHDLEQRKLPTVEPQLVSRGFPIHLLGARDEKK